MLDHFSMIERESIVSLSQKSLFENSDDAEEARDYIFNKRKILESVAEKFGIGYVPTRVLDKRISGKIIFPIYDCHFSLVAISTRDFRNTQKNRGHWHESFNKKNHFYGFSQSLKSMVEKKEVILVEGQFDVMSMHSHGFLNCVGILGSHMSMFHAFLLSRFVDSFIFAFDNDEAGRKAIIESGNILLKSGLLYDKDISYFGVDIGSYKDPDDLLKFCGREEMEMHITASRNRKKYDRKRWTADVLDISID